MKLTHENYYSPEANQAYMSVSQFKAFDRCEAAALAELRGEDPEELAAYTFDNAKRIYGIA